MNNACLLYYPTGDYIIYYINKILKPAKHQPTIISSATHGIKMELINPYAKKVLQQLNNVGFQAHLVGGVVRDLLLGLKPKDFDVATDALPEEIKKTFTNCRLIGRRFRLAHVYFNRTIIEVATFRAQKDSTMGERQLNESGMLIRDNLYGSMEDDAWRRDFTINALYFNYADSQIIDYTGGLEDLQNHCIRVIGDPIKRYHEDPVRMLRAIRLAAKLNFTIEPESEKPIFELAGLLQNVASLRLLEEIIKLYKSGKSQKAFALLRQHGIFSVLFPQTEACFSNSNQIYENFLTNAFAIADQRVAKEKSLNSAFLFATILWPPFKHLLDQYEREGKHFYAALSAAMDKVIRQQNKSLAISRRLLSIIKEIWTMQYRLSQIRRYPLRIEAFFFHPRFRAAYDFLLLRAFIDESVKETCEFWTKFQTVDKENQKKMIDELQNVKTK